MATVTKIIDSNGAIGVNCDFDSIEDWAWYVSNQSNPDQVGIVRGEHGYPYLALDSFTSFAVPTTQDACPRLIGDPGWQAGHSLYTTSDPPDAPHLFYLTLTGTFDSGNMRHFKVQGIQIDSMDVSLSVEGEGEAGIWFDSVAAGYSASFQMLSSALENFSSSLKVLFTNCLFVGDSSADCLYFDESQAAGYHSIAFVHSIITKGATVNWSGWSGLNVYVINCVQMSQEGYGFQTNAAALTVSHNASYPPSQHADQLGTIYTLSGNQDNYGVFNDSYYYASDFRLPAGSPLIDLGITPIVPGWNLTSLKDVAGTLRPRGSGYDIGLFEYPSALDSSLMLLCF